MADNGEASIVQIQRSCFGTTATPHLRSNPMCWVSATSRNNCFTEESKYPSFEISRVKDCLTHTVPDVCFINVPVLFMESSPRKFVAGSANMVNAVIAGGTVYMTDPGCALFRDSVSIPGATFIGGTNVWELYHCWMGELHCGSEAERWFPARPPFWKRPEFKAWPFEKKETTP